MTKRQLEFCTLFAQGLSAQEAAEKAGYVKNGIGKHLLSQTEIQEVIAHFRYKAADIAEEGEILSFLTSMMRGDTEADIRTRVRAAELLTKKSKIAEKETDEDSVVMIVDDVL